MFIRALSMPNIAVARSPATIQPSNTQAAALPPLYVPTRHTPGSSSAGDWTSPIVDEPSVGSSRTEFARRTSPSGKVNTQTREVRAHSRSFAGAFVPSGPSFCTSRSTIVHGKLAALAALAHRVTVIRNPRLDMRPNVDVTGDCGKVRPQGADARGRPC